MFIKITDQCDRTISLTEEPLRIVSLVPSQTELLFDLGLEEKIVGKTRFCIHPVDAIKNVQVVGGTKKVVIDRIIDLDPDLIICNREENTLEIVEACERIAPTYCSHIETLDHALCMISDMGKLTNTIHKAANIITRITEDFKHLNTTTTAIHALYLIWKKPYMTVGSDTFIHDMMQRAGFENVLKEQLRYPQLEISDIIALNPDVIFFSSEPYSFQSEDLQEIRNAFDQIKEHDDGLSTASAKAKKPHPLCITVDGEMFSWYGSRLLKSVAYFQQLQMAMSGANME